MYRRGDTGAKTAVRSTHHGELNLRLIAGSNFLVLYHGINTKILSYLFKKRSIQLFRNSLYQLRIAGTSADSELVRANQQWPTMLG